MKIAVLNNCEPFVSGGAEYLADGLIEALRASGHEAQLFRLPFQWSPSVKVVEAMAACRLLRLDGVDRVIALKFPAYLVPHPNKVLWLLHQFRQAYDLWGTPWQDLHDADGPEVRETVIRSDRTCLPEARAIFTNSHVTRDRLRAFSGFDAEVLHPPLRAPERFHCEEYGDYIFYPSRITRGKRQGLVVDALGRTRTPVRLVIAGMVESPEGLRDIETLVETHGLADRVTVIPRFIDEAEKVALFARALACAYTPVDEDSYGYVTLEAYHARKPVISCVDSGGVSIVVRHGDTGFLTDPTPDALARAMDDLYLNRAKARAMGEAGFQHLEQLHITWDNVIRRLTA